MKPKTSKIRSLQALPTEEEPAEVPAFSALDPAAVSQSSPSME